MSKKPQPNSDQPKNNRQVGRWTAFVVTLVALGLFFLQLARSLMPEKEVKEMDDYAPWADEVVNEFAMIPVQDGGRVKPMETFASYTMLRLRGDRRVLIEDKEGEVHKVKPVPWLLDVFFRPKFAITTPSFRVDNSEVFELLGLEGKEKRDRYSYVEIADARDKLLELRDVYTQKKQANEDLTPSQTQTLDLANNVTFYELLLGYFTFAREGIELKEAGEGGSSKYQRISSVMATSDIIRNLITEGEKNGTEPPPRIRDLLEQVTYLSNLSRAGLLLFPPDSLEENAAWNSAGARIFGTLTGTVEDPGKAIEDISELEALYSTSNTETEKFVEALSVLRKDIEGRADKRGELSSLAWEHRFNEGQWFFRAMFFCFLPGILALVLSWLNPDSRWGRIMAKIVWVTCILGLVMVITGTTLRSIIMARPPVGNLYDTMPFITIGCVLLALITEGLTKRRMALGLAPIIGFVGLAMARMYEFGEGQDPMNPLIAVLRSNYWLTIHVLTITLGYSAGLVAAGFGVTFMLRKVFGLYGKNEKSERRAITRMTYGVICFTLLLSLIGTVLGGVWANYSWGRFWGWDPKENGALLLVLWTLFILHGRIGGYLKEWGINLCAIFTAAIVTFSWWHVNLLGVGLHSYGFSDSKLTAVWAVYKLIGFVLLIGIGYALAEKLGKPQQKKEKAATGDAGQEPVVT